MYGWIIHNKINNIQWENRKGELSLYGFLGILTSYCFFIKAYSEYTGTSQKHLPPILTHKQMSHDPGYL